MKLEPYKQKIDQILEETVLFSDDSWVLKDCKKENAIGGCRGRAGCIWPGFGTLFRGGTARDPDNCPNDTIINVHNRIPVLLTDDEVMPWLQNTGIASAKLTALRPAWEGAAV